MRTKNPILFCFKVFRKGSELANYLPFRIVSVKAFVIIPCCFYFFLVFFTGECFGSGNGFFLSFVKSIHDKNMIMFAMFDVHNGIFEGDKKIVNKVVSFLSAFDKYTVVSVEDGTNQNADQKARYSKKIKIGFIEFYEEDFHEVAFFLIPWWMGTIIALVIIFSGTQHILDRKNILQNI